jgi:hypothetical protein
LEQARRVESEWQDKFNFNARHLTNEINTIAADRDRAVAAELRKRSARPAGVSETPRPECSGGTGAELSGADAEFLVRESARADKQRAALMACYSAIDSLRTPSRKD